MPNPTLPPSPKAQPVMAHLLVLSAFFIATCGLVYELIAGTAASYLLGDSVTQFSTVIGCYLFAMGVGSWLSRYVSGNLLLFFVRVELLVGLVGGCSAALLFFLFNWVDSFRIVLYSLVFIIGALVGVEIPLLLRLLEGQFDFKDLVSRVFAVDYVGALFAAIVFPLVLIPRLGLVRSGFLFGLLNIAVGLAVLFLLARHTNAQATYRLSKRQVRQHLFLGLTFALILSIGWVYANQIMRTGEQAAYAGQIIYSKSSPYQRLVLTRQRDDIRLYLNGNLQFSSVDEYRYHEALVHPAMGAAPAPHRVLVIGGGDGLAVREILKYPSVQQVTLVDLDPTMSQLFSRSHLLTALNQQALLNPKVQVVHQDGFMWLRQHAQHQHAPRYDVVIVDLPDPSNYSLGKLYSVPFYKALKAVTHAQSRVVIQSTAPLIARHAYWCIVHTLQAAGFYTTPYHAYVPSFGEWGYVLASPNALSNTAQYPQGLRYFSPHVFDNMLYFPADMAEVPTNIQTLNEQALVHYFEREWSDYLEGKSLP